MQVNVTHTDHRYIVLESHKCIVQQNYSDKKKLICFVTFYVYGYRHVTELRSMSCHAELLNFNWSLFSGEGCTTSNSGKVEQLHRLS